MLSAQAKDFKEKIGAAIAREFEVATELSTGERKNQVRDGIQDRQKGSSFIYVFNELTGTPPEEGMKVSFSVGEKKSQGRYLGEVDSQYQFELEDDFGPTIEVANIGSDPLFLIEKQVELLKNDALFENQVALASLGLTEYPPVASCHPKSIFAEGLNRHQADALNVAGENAVTYIWGPPGTGKTTTMGSLVAALAELGQKVLLISNTNLAVDTALERCLDRFKLVSPVSEGLMLRLGNPVKPEIKDKYGSLIDLDDILRKKVAPIQEEITKCSSTLQKLKDKTEDLETAKSEFRTHVNATKILDKQTKELEKLEQEIRDSKKIIVDSKARIKSLEVELAESEAKSAVSRFFGATRNPGQIRMERDQLNRNVEQAEKSNKRCTTSLPNLKKEVESLQAASAKSVKWLILNPSEASIDAKITVNRSQQSELQKRIEKLQVEITGKRKQIVADARVVACTAYKPLIDKEIIDLEFDVVVIDEASMIPLSLFYCSAAKATSRIVIAGDFRQLPPIVQVGTKLKKENFKVSASDAGYKELLTMNPFTYSKVIDGIGQETESAQLVALRDQYRMRKDISDLISDFFYPEHTLKTIENRMDKETPWGNESFIIFDTSRLGPESSRVQTSWRNIIHALVIKSMSDSLIADGWEFPSTAKKSFAVLSPFNKQTTFIRSLVTPSGIKGVEGGISTVHRFQGNERDLMIVDITKVASADDPGLGNFLGNIDPLAVENAMWNVGISRARQHVLVVVDLPTLARNSGAVVSQIVNKMIKKGKVIDASELLSEESIEVLRDLPQSATGSISWYTGDGFYAAFQKDLKKSQSKVIISSPFTMPDATAKWEPLLRDLVAKDVEVSILTKPASEKKNSGDSALIHKNLASFVKELREIPKMHEKLAVLDGRIVWLGSLNILSHYKASEVMVRIESPDFAQSISTEYQYQRTAAPTQKLSNISTSLKKGDKCNQPGCDGVIREVPAGVSQKTQRAYPAFLSCSNFPRCKTT
jgi:superfamily I DNA and/or RNA helicase